MKYNNNLSQLLKLCFWVISILIIYSCKKNVSKVKFKPKTYCNPIDIDYTYSVVNTSKGLSYRSGADPAVVRHKNGFYMFVTRSQGYWYSEDMQNWTFIDPNRWYFESSNAPGAWSSDDTFLVAASPNGYQAMLTTNDPFNGDWKAQPSIIPIELHDPALFIDDDKKTYVFEGSSNILPIQGVELASNNYYLPKGELVPLFGLNAKEHGWERFGESHISKINPFIEGAWLTKHNNKYYMQYAAPGTQWNVYANGVYVSDHPLGPYEYASYSPISYKPGGFITGAGHGSTVQDNNNDYWHFATMRVSVNYLFERRLGMFPAGFDMEGQMYVNTAYGDYPHFLPNIAVPNHQNRFSGWMLLSYKKPVVASSVEEEEKMNRNDISSTGYMLPLENMSYEPKNVTDENIQTFWVAQTNSKKEWLEIDLQSNDSIFAVQINYQDFNSNIYGKADSLYHQFVIEYSLDKKNWKIAADYSDNNRDQPNAYIELQHPVIGRYIRFKNLHVPTSNLAISGFRVFGLGPGDPPDGPKNFNVIRDANDNRNAFISWDDVKNAHGYTIYWGISKEKLNNSAMVLDNNFYDLQALNLGVDYYFAIEAFNKNGISDKSILE